MSEKLVAPRGCVDLFGEEMRYFNMAETLVKEVCATFNFKEIRTPIFEHTEVFHRDENDSSDVVSKEMYTFTDKGGRSITLRPEGTAGVIRSFVQNNYGAEGLPIRAFYIGPCFRYERPQAGRLRQFNQFGAEVIGSKSVEADLEIILLAREVLNRVGLKDVTLNINSLGDAECRKAYNEKLVAYLNDVKGDLCEKCNERLLKNPLRVLDCKNSNCNSITKNAPKTIDNLGEQCASEFNVLLQKLDNLGVKYVVNKDLVRGLDYYTKTVFEFVSNEIGAQGTICGGGRYNGLVEEFGAKKTECVGFGLGIERLIMAYKAVNEPIAPIVPDVYIGAISDKGEEMADLLSVALRKQNAFIVEYNYDTKKAKNLIKNANKVSAKITIIIGDDEVLNNTVVFKRMSDGEQLKVDVNEYNLLSFDKNDKLTSLINEFIK